MEKIKAILFDLDNTLLDFMEMKKESCKAAIQAMICVGLKMDKDQAYSKLMETYFALGLESDEAFSQFLKQIGQFDHKILAAAINKYLETKNEYVKLYPNVKSVLETLKEKGIILSILTDAPKTKAYQRILRLGIDQYLRFVVGFEDTNLKKHTGLPLKLAIEMLKKENPDLLNSEILMVGDSIARDLVPARKLGLKTALSKYGQTETEEGLIDYELRTFDDILEII